MPYVNYPTIQQTYGGPLGVANMDFGNIASQWQQQQNALRNEELNQASAQQELEKNKQMLPYQVSAEEELARQRKLSNNLDEQKAPMALAELRGKLNKQDWDALDQSVRQLGQLGASVESNGGVVPLHIRSYLSSSDQGKQILNELDNNKDYAKQLRVAGEEWNRHSAKAQAETQKQKSAYDLLREKLEAQAAIAEANNRSRERQAQARMDAARKALGSKPMKQDKLSYENYAIELDKHADAIALDNPQAATTLRERAAFYRNEAVKKASAGAAVRANQESDVIRAVTGIDVNKPKEPADPYAGFKIR